MSAPLARATARLYDIGKGFHIPKHLGFLQPRISCILENTSAVVAVFIGIGYYMWKRAD